MGTLAHKHSQHAKALHRPENARHRVLLLRDREKKAANPRSLHHARRAVSRTKGLARFIKSTLGSTTASMQSLGSMHSMMASTRPVKSPSRWAAGEASSRFNLPAYQSAANIRTGRSVASLASNTYPAPPVRDHGRAFTGGPVNAASQRALRVAYDSAPPLEPSQTALQHRLRGGFAHNNIGTLTTGVGELEARRDFRAAGQAGVLPRLTDTDVTEIPYLRRGSPPEPSQGPRTTKFHPRMPPAAPAFETVFLRTPQAARPARGDIQKQREEGHGAGVGFMGFNGDMNMRSSINYADKGTALYAEPSYTFHGEKPFGRSPADPSTLVRGALAAHQYVPDVRFAPRLDRSHAS